MRMACRRFTRVTNAFAKKLDNHAAAVAQKIADRVWSIGELLDAALATQPIDPVVTAPDRRRKFRVIEGGKE